METDPRKQKFQDIKNVLEQKPYQYQILRTLGKGSFGEVFLLEYPSDSEFHRNSAAAKCITKESLRRRPHLQKYIQQEIQAMRTIVHPNIVRLQRVIESKQFHFMVLEYCDGGNLLTRQAKLKHKIFPEDQAVGILVQVMKGLQAIHKAGYIHRDIKSENVLIKYTLQGEPVFKIADFGFARPLRSGTANTICGTEKYMAPEILENLPYGVEVDIWALGVLFFFMLYGEYPFRGFDLLADINRRCRGGFKVKDVLIKKERCREHSRYVEDFFNRIFVIEPHKRMAFNEMVDHPLFKNYAHEFESRIPTNTQILQEVPYPPESSDDESEDESRSSLYVKSVFIDETNQHIEREIQYCSFEIDKISYLRECAEDFYENYKQIFPATNRLAVRYYVLRAFLFYAQLFLGSLEMKQIPKEMEKYKLLGWSEFIKSKQFVILSENLKIDLMKGTNAFQDTYYSLEQHVESLKIPNFQDKFSLAILESEFEQFKVPYRLTTSYMFKMVQENMTADEHTKNKLKMRLFCCHMINRIFEQSEIGTNFEYFFRWLAQKGQNHNVFDFTTFKKWILCDSKENLNKNILLLHKKFFGGGH